MSFKKIFTGMKEPGRESTGFLQDSCHTGLPVSPQTKSVLGRTVLVLKSGEGHPLKS